MSDLPSPLINAVVAGRAVLFLGSGASIGSMHPQGKGCPNSKMLGDSLSDKFLGGKLKNLSLSEVSQYCESEAGRNAVQSFIKDIFIDFHPSDFHKLIPTFRWQTIATTNYDLIIERAYESEENTIQTLVPFYKNNQLVEEECKKKTHPLKYLKLHGCISQINDENIPLILTPEQYIKFEQNRSRLFDMLKNLSYEFPVIFCGYSISDINIRKILADLVDDNIYRPSYYTVQPGISDIESRFYMQKRITSINKTFEQFLYSLDSVIPINNRILSSLIPVETSLARHYCIRGINESKGLVSFLDQDAMHIFPGMPINRQDPKLYYKGFDSGFGGISANLDIKRGVSDTILTDVVLSEEGEKKKNIELYVIDGAAGNGKTTVLKRVAWDAANEFDALVFYFLETGAVRNEMLEEIYIKTKKRIFAFIDRAALRLEEIHDCLVFFRNKDIKLTIFTAERSNEWNVRCDKLNVWVTSFFTVRYLSEKEVQRIILKLGENKALGLLSEKSHAEQVSAFLDRAQRQLLVALHEATLGKPFEEIVLDEYRRITPDKARLIYLDICSLHRYGVGVRAGLISRMSGIFFDEFKNELFKPLENVVFSTHNKYAGDHEFRTRHPHVAEIVFDQVLSSQDEKLNQLIRVLKGMNIDYSSDREAYVKIVKGRLIAGLFSAPEMGRKFYEIAYSVFGDDSYLLHQEGVFELNHPNGSLDRAEKILLSAESKAPNDFSVQHSLANVYRSKALGAKNALLKKELRGRALARLTKSKNSGIRNPYEVNTRLQIALDELKDIFLEHDMVFDQSDERVLVEKN